MPNFPERESARSHGQGWTVGWLAVYFHLPKSYRPRVNFEELRREAENLPVSEQKKLLGFLVSLEVRRDENFSRMLGERLDDRNPENWISLKDVQRQLNTDGV